MTAAGDELSAALATDGLRIPASAGMLLEAYAGQVSRLRDAQARVDKEGAIVPGPRDQAVPHPALAIERAAASEVAKLHAAIVKQCCAVKALEERRAREEN